jgi:hypothetical protein
MIFQNSIAKKINSKYFNINFNGLQIKINGKFYYINILF